MKYFVTFSLILIFALVFPAKIHANAAGTKQFTSLEIKTTEGEVLAIDARGEELRKVSFASHGDHWVIRSCDVNIHGGRVALSGFQLSSGSYKDRKGIERAVTVLYIPLIFDVLQPDGKLNYDDGHVEIDFFSGGGVASIEVWHDKVSPKAIEHIEIKQ